MAACCLFRAVNVTLFEAYRSGEGVVRGTFTPASAEQNLESPGDAEELRAFTELECYSGDQEQSQSGNLTFLKIVCTVKGASVKVLLTDDLKWVKVKHNVRRLFLWRVRDSRIRRQQPPSIDPEHHNIASAFPSAGLIRQPCHCGEERRTQWQICSWGDGEGSGGAGLKKYTTSDPRKSMWPVLLMFLELGNDKIIG